MITVENLNYFADIRIEDELFKVTLENERNQLFNISLSLKDSWKFFESEL